MIAMKNLERRNRGILNYKLNLIRTQVPILRAPQIDILWGLCSLINFISGILFQNLSFKFIIFKNCEKKFKPKSKQVFLFLFIIFCFFTNYSLKTYFYPSDCINQSSLHFETHPTLVHSSSRFLINWHKLHFWI